MNAEQRRQIGARVKTARESRGWTQAELAHKANLGSANTVSSLERGNDVKSVSLRKILDALGIVPESTAVSAAGYPPEVEMARNMVGLYLSAKPVDERPAIIGEMTAWLMSREKSTPGDKS